MRLMWNRLLRECGLNSHMKSEHRYRFVGLKIHY